MKKDIQIPEVNEIFMAIVKEYNEEFQCEDWNAYIINDKQVDLDMVLILSKGFTERKTRKGRVFEDGKRELYVYDKDPSILGYMFKKSDRSNKVISSSKSFTEMVNKIKNKWNFLI